ncbi:MAG: ATP-binding protein [Spirochaetaceae bacterium]|jgi:anti-sigma regulatory factor (Ser/Thr protein kinase)|nr:ATP-binding protein [Spirochaetaceae bacterium]
MGEHEITVPASVEELDRLQAWAEEKTGGCSDAARSQLAVVIEELFVNIARYAYAGETGEVVARLAVRGADVVMSFEDQGAAFNPLDYPAPDPNAALEERGIGGLGIYLARAMTDRLSYQRINGKNHLSFSKRIKP